MVKIINNLWSMIKMVLILIFMLITVKFVGTDKLVEVGLICLGFYFSYKLIDLLSVYLKNKINGFKVDKTVKVVEEINPEVKLYFTWSVRLRKRRKTIKDKNTLDLLGIKLKQLKNV